MPKKQEPEPDDLITYTEAAELRGYRDTSAVSRLVERERVKGYKKFGKPLVSKAEIKAYKPQKGGRPKPKEGGE